ncbi:unannotated protein [freshwater metagenome]|uniref:Unannotated protein n=1 Tax=freshwater metagenome TaxID=449393 RepID=A0A6J7Q343_9ZZZZ
MRWTDAVNALYRIELHRNPTALAANGGAWRGLDDPTPAKAKAEAEAEAEAESRCSDGNAQVIALRSRSQTIR